MIGSLLKTALLCFSSIGAALPSALPMVHNTNVEQTLKYGRYRFFSDDTSFDVSQNYARYEISGDIYNANGKYCNNLEVVLTNYIASQINEYEIQVFMDGVSVYTSSHQDQALSDYYYIANATYTTDVNATSYTWSDSLLPYNTEFNFDLVSMVEGYAHTGYTNYHRVSGGYDICLYILGKVDNLNILNSTHTFTAYNGLFKVFYEPYQTDIYIKSIELTIKLDSDEDVHHVLYPSYYVSKVSFYASYYGINGSYNEEIIVAYGNTNLTWDATLKAYGIYNDFSDYRSIYCSSINEVCFLNFNSPSDNNNTGGIGGGNNGGIIGGSTSTDNIWTNTFLMLSKAFDSISSFLGINVLPGVSIGLLVCIPLFIGIMLFIIHIFKRG